MNRDDAFAKLRRQEACSHVWAATEEACTSHGVTWRTECTICGRYVSRSNPNDLRRSLAEMSPPDPGSGATVRDSQEHTGRTDSRDQSKCEWPKRIGSLDQCGASAKAVVIRETPNGGWMRSVCGVHLNAALRRDGWARMRPKCPDHGTCHHECSPAAQCYRSICCGAFTGVFPDDKWPTDSPPVFEIAPR